MGNNLKFILCACFLLFPFSTGYTEEGLYINGSDWARWSAEKKSSFVLGWAKGGIAASDNYFLEINELDKATERFNRQQSAWKNDGVLLGGVTIGQIVQTVSKIYSDPRVTTTDISDVMPLVSGRLIQGWTEKELDEVIAMNVKIKRCEEKEKEQKKSEACGSLRNEKILFLNKLKK